MNYSPVKRKIPGKSLSELAHTVLDSLSTNNEPISHTKLGYSVRYITKENERLLFLFPLDESSKLGPAFKGNQNKVIRSMRHLISNYYFHNSRWYQRQSTKYKYTKYTAYQIY